MVGEDYVLDLNCGLCGNDGMTFVCEDKRRPFYLCGDCGLISVPEHYWLSAHDERNRYDLHDNTISNNGYVKYLSQAAEIVSSLHRRGEKVLDFGCGENAVLCRLLSDNGIDCRAYDPLYGNISTINTRDEYDTIILCEVIEHLRNITAELSLIKNLLRDNGTLVIRTQIYDDPKVFPNWWYAQDPTHINFFNEKSLNKLASIISKKIRATKYPDIFIVE